MAVGLLFCQTSGEYWLQMFDSFTGTLPLLFICFFELVGVSWVYGANRWGLPYKMAFKITLTLVLSYPRCKNIWNLLLFLFGWDEEHKRSWNGIHNCIKQPKKIGQGFFLHFPRTTPCVYRRVNVSLREQNRNIFYAVERKLFFTGLRYTTSDNTVPYKVYMFSDKYEVLDWSTQLFSH